MTMTTDAQPVAIFCGDCGTKGVVASHQVTASLRCRCGSGNLGLDGVDNIQATAAGGTGWGKAMPDPLAGWSEYAGPTPQTFPRSAPVADTTVCPVCHGSKYDLIDKGPCRECGGTGYIVHPTQRGPEQNYDPGRPTPPGSASLAATGGLTAEAVAKLGGRPYQGPGLSPEQIVRSSTPGYGGNPESFSERSPAVKVREERDYNAPTGPYQMDQAACPNCGHAPTELVKDKNEDAWWHCPNCGPLANIDRNPAINPYDPPSNFTPDRSMKRGGFLSRNRKTGRLIAILAKIHEANEMNPAEAVEIARKTIIRYPESR